MKKTTIRSRLLIALLVPVLAVAITAGLGVITATSEVAEVDKQATLALAAGGPSTLVTALMDERNITALELIGLDGAVDLRVGNSTEARKETDTYLASFEEMIAKSSDEVKAIYLPVIEGTKTALKSARAEADSYKGVRDLKNTFAEGVFDEFSSAITPLHVANATSIEGIDDAELRNRANSSALLSLTSDVQAQIARYVALASLRGGATNIDLAQTGKEYGRFVDSSTEAKRILGNDPAALAVVGGFYDRPNTERFGELTEAFLVEGTADPVAVIDTAADTAAPSSGDAWEAIRDSIARRADVLRSEARSDRANNITLFLVATGLTLLVGFFAARALSKPLLKLAEEAETMSGSLLPQAVNSVLNTAPGADIKVPEMAPISGSKISEISEVSSALNQVQSQTLALAVEQAALRRNTSESFVNLGRRVQSLVGRQLQLITKLEDDEQDPDSLEGLYALDHLATRVRRNAESLVVLAGNDNSRRTKRSKKTVSMVDVMRSANSEVEDYQRVEISATPDDLISEMIASDLAHILAEMVENGLQFSPPQSNVNVRGEHVLNGYLISVVDAGIGMDAEAIAGANIRLAGEESFTVSPSKYLGHYVAGSLARKYDIEVSLASNPSSGVTASIFVPAAYMSLSSEPEVKEQSVIAPFDDAVRSVDSDGRAQDVPVDIIDVDAVAPAPASVEEAPVHAWTGTAKDDVPVLVPVRKPVSVPDNLAPETGVIKVDGVAPSVGDIVRAHRAVMGPLDDETDETSATWSSKV